MDLSDRQWVARPEVCRRAWALATLHHALRGLRACHPRQKGGSIPRGDRELGSIAHFHIAALRFRRLRRHGRDDRMRRHGEELRRRLRPEGRRRRTGLRLLNERAGQSKRNHSALTAVHAVGPAGRGIGALAESVTLTEATGVAAHHLVGERSVPYAARHRSQRATIASLAAIALILVRGASDDRSQQERC
jgi:hypothetical protein